MEPGDIVFVDHPKYYDKALESKATIILINKQVDCPNGKALLISDDPFRDFNKLTTFFQPFVPSSQSIAATAKIGKDTVIQPNTFVGNNVVIGENCIIHSNVTIYDNCLIGDNVTIGDNVIVFAGATPGSTSSPLSIWPSDRSRSISSSSNFGRYSLMISSILIWIGLL